MYANTIPQTHVVLDDRVGADADVVTNLIGLAHQHAMTCLESAANDRSGVDDGMRADVRLIPDY
jgi:hypothetical protein